MLQVLTIDEAKERLLAQAVRTGRIETIPVAEAVGRVLAADVRASADVPGFSRSSVDGLAVRAADTFGASDTMPAMLQRIGAVPMGQMPSFAIRPGECASVPTGGAIPAGADAMVMIEYVENPGDDLMLVNRAVSPGDHLVLRGDDLTAGQAILTAGHRVRVADLGTFAALAIDRVSVHARPRVAILSTGDELVPIGTRLQPGQIHDINSTTLAGLVRQAGGEPVLLGIVPDCFDMLDTCLKQALSDSDFILVSGGSSVGEKDHLREAIAAQGEPGILFHGIAVKPGKPTLAGVAGGRVLLGLPGHPLAAWFMAILLALPVIHALQGSKAPEPDRIIARTACRIPSNAGRESILPVRLIPDPRSPDSLLAEPVFTKSGLITVLSRSEGFIRINRRQEGLEADTPVVVIRYPTG